MPVCRETVHSEMLTVRKKAIGHVGFYAIIDEPYTCPGTQSCAVQPYVSATSTVAVGGAAQIGAMAQECEMKRAPSHTFRSHTGKSRKMLETFGEIGRNYQWLPVVCPWSYVFTLCAQSVPVYLVPPVFPIQCLHCPTVSWQRAPDVALRS